VQPDPRDRYLSFVGLDCDANARRVVERVPAHIAEPSRSNPFWEQFRAKREGRSGPARDDRFLVHSNVYYIRELLETWGDEVGLAPLD
jgi:hypothetical protein